MTMEFYKDFDPQTDMSDLRKLFGQTVLDAALFGMGHASWKYVAEQASKYGTFIRKKLTTCDEAYRPSFENWRSDARKIYEYAEDELLKLEEE